MSVPSLGRELQFYASYRFAGCELEQLGGMHAQNKCGRAKVPKVVQEEEAQAQEDVVTSIRVCLWERRQVRLCRRGTAN